MVHFGRVLTQKAELMLCSNITAEKPRFLNK